MRHTRKQPPTVQVRDCVCAHIQELLDDRERIRIVQHNAMVLQMREEAHKAQLEANREREHEYALEEQSRSEQPFEPTPKDAEQGTEEAVQSAVIQPARRRG